jgi:hypothetical protein
VLITPVVSTTPVVPLGSVVLADTPPVLLPPPLLLPGASVATPVLLPPSVTPLASVVLVTLPVVGTVAVPEEEASAVVSTPLSVAVTVVVALARSPSSEHAEANASRPAARDKGFEFMPSCAPSEARDASVDHPAGPRGRVSGGVANEGVARMRAKPYASAVLCAALTAG